MPKHIINTGNQTVSGNFTAIGNLSATGLVNGLAFVTITPANYAILVAAGTTNSNTIYIVQE